MSKLKPHLSVKQIAKKHRLDVSFIQNQLNMGEPIEHEHTKDHNLAMDIALQHLDEIPDYYTRLKKMESSAKKEHKKFKDVKESREEKRYCPLCDKRETRSECSYGDKTWDKVSVRDKDSSITKESVRIEDLNGNHYAEFIDIIKPEPLKPTRGIGNRFIEEDNKKSKIGNFQNHTANKEMEESLSFQLGSEFKKQQKINKASKIASKGATNGEKSAGKEAVRRLGGTGAELPTIKTEEKLVDKILSELQEEKPCWDKYTQVGMKKGRKGKPVPNCVPSEGVPKAKGYKKKSLDEAVRIQAQNGNIISVTLSWRGKYYALRTFFPQSRLPSRKEVNDEIQKIYPGSKVVAFGVSDLSPGQPLLQIQNSKSKNYLLNNKTIGEGVEIEEGKKSEMPCNKPKAEAHGSGETGKSHVVKACDSGKEKLIRFGQLGVKGSPKKKGESEEYASRRHRFQTRHAKNIEKGKMSAAYWANKVKW